MLNADQSYYCFVYKGWLEPLLSVIAANSSHVATPLMDIIDDDTFVYKPFDVKSANIGGFDWNLQFVWISVPDRERERRHNVVEPIR